MWKIFLLFLISIALGACSTNSSTQSFLTEEALVSKGAKVLTSELLVSHFQDKTYFGEYLSTPSASFGENLFIEQAFSDGTIRYKYCDFYMGKPSSCGGFVQGIWKTSNNEICYSYPQSGISNRCFKLFDLDSTIYSVATTYKHKGYARAKINRIIDGIVIEPPFE